MRFRPCYSLLTLLILTTLVASGLQYWRGPHWFKLSDLPTAKERALLGEFAEYPLLQQQFAAETHCLYLNKFAGTELLQIQSRPGPDVCWLVESVEFGPRYGGSQLYLLDVPLANFREQSSVETIRFSCSSPQMLLPLSDPVSVSDSVSLKPIPDLVHSARIPTGYFVSDRKRVYRSRDVWKKVIFLSLIQVSEITDPKLRELIEQELASIPDPQ